MTDALVTFLLARLDERGAFARKAARAGSGRWGTLSRPWDAEPYRDLADQDTGERIARLFCDLDRHIALNDPAFVLADIEAKRRIVERLGQQYLIGSRVTYNAVLRLLALPFADHPDFQPEWRL